MCNPENKVELIAVIVDHFKSTCIRRNLKYPLIVLHLLTVFKQNMLIPSFEGRGWNMTEEGNIKPVWYQGEHRALLKKRM